MPDSINTRRCSSCEATRAITEFSPGPAYRGGRRPQCRQCRADYEKRRRKSAGFVYKPLAPEVAHDRHLKLTYGISREQYLALLASQGGGCGICGKPPKTAYYRNLFVDHCHETGRVRGLLCNRCNVALGKFGDGLTGLRAALAYLEKSENSNAY